MGRSGGGGRSGGRSSGGFSSGGRGSGGFSGGLGGGSGRSSGRSGSSSGGSFRPSGGGFRPSGGWFRPSGPVYSGGGGYHPGGMGPPPSGGGCCLGRGCLSAFVILVVIFIALMILGGISSTMSGTVTANSSGSSGSVAKSTVVREALPASACTETGYYTDEEGWFTQPSKLESGLKYFYKKTGVQPYVYVVGSAHGTTISALQDFADQQYDKLFTDEGHYLMVFYDTGSGSYRWVYTVGTQAKTIMDSEANEILYDYVDRYYTDGSISDEEFFSLSFEKTADRIMSVTKPAAAYVMPVVGVIAVLLIAFLWWLKAVKARQKKAEQTAQILNTPLEEMGDAALKDLEDKYRDQKAPDSRQAEKKEPVRPLTNQDLIDKFRQQTQSKE